MRVLAGSDDGKSVVGVDDACVDGGGISVAGIHISAGQQSDCALAGGADGDAAQRNISAGRGGDAVGLFAHRGDGGVVMEADMRAVVAGVEAVRTIACRLDR